MSFAYVSSPGVPGMRPKNFSGDGTLSDAGMWSTSSVVMRGSCRCCRISFVYSSSCFCGVVAGAAANANTALARTAILAFIEFSSEEEILPRDAARSDQRTCDDGWRVRRDERDNVTRIPVEPVPVRGVRDI